MKLIFLVARECLKLQAWRMVYSDEDLRLTSNFIYCAFNVLYILLIIMFKLQVCVFILFSFFLSFFPHNWGTFLLAFLKLSKRYYIYIYIYSPIFFVCVIIPMNFYSIPIKLLGIIPPCGYISFKYSQWIANLCRSCTIWNFGKYCCLSFGLNSI